MSVTQTNRTYTSQAKGDSIASISARKKQSYKNLRYFMERQKKSRIYKPPTVVKPSNNKGKAYLTLNFQTSPTL